MSNWSPPPGLPRVAAPAPADVARIRVMLAADGSVVNVARVIGDRIVSVIWQRPSSVAEAPFTFVFEQGARDAA